MNWRFDNKHIINYDFDHIDIVVTHDCNMNCKHCIDKFRRTSNKVTRLTEIERFLQLIRKHTDKSLEVLLLGGDPSVVVLII